MNRCRIELAAALLALLSAILLTGCRKTMKSDEDFIRKAREIMPIGNAERVMMWYAGFVQDPSDSTVSLHWVVSGDEHEEHAYLPMECERAVPAWKYTYAQHFEAAACMEDVMMLTWRGQLVFCINNTDVRGMRLTDADGGDHYVSFEQIPYSAYPFLRKYDASCRSYRFLDAEGNELLVMTVSD